MNRRKFCASSVAAAVSAAAAGHACVLAAGQVIAAPRMRLYKFIFDERYAAARAFGAAGEHACSSAGAAAIHGDVTALWSNELRREWLAGGGAIAGMTTARTLFCLEQLAKDHWMRVTLRAEHAAATGPVVAHRLTAPEAMVAPMRSALAAADWPAQTAGVLATCPGRDGAPRSTSVFASAAGRRWAMTHPTLVSFVIA
jgi:hypothetical protein